MKSLAVPFRQLVERRLWPVAILLVAAAVAMPFVLRDEVEGPPASSGSAGAIAAPADTETIVSAADPALTDTERRVLGAPKNPFRPAVAARPAPDPTAAPGTARATSSATTVKVDLPGSGGSPATPASPSGGGSPAPVDPDPAPTPDATPTPTPAAKPTYPLYSLVARFGAVGEQKMRRLVLRSTGLPSNSRIGLVYKGVLKNERTAVFWVVRGTEVEGDGTCVPGPENCQYVRIDPGETLFFTMPNGDQYQLDLLRVHAGRADAKAARAQASKALPRRVQGGAGRYRYDWREGLLEAVTHRELQATASQASAGVPLG